MELDIQSSSFRDPSGQVFFFNDKIYRLINMSYIRQYDKLMDCGLYSELVSKNLLIRHDEADLKDFKIENAHKIIRPRKIPFISHPYEWCFSQLKDAALTTLKIQRIALSHGMCLKDASAYNIQFLDGLPVLMDTLSFDFFSGKPWAAYRQFCQHFLAPLALMKYADPRMNRLSMSFIDGVPIDMARRMLPARSFLNPGILLHIIMHSGICADEGTKRDKIKIKEKSISVNSALGLADSLKNTVSKMNIRPKKTVWSQYYPKHSNYDESAAKKKAEIVDEMIHIAGPKKVLDLGANDGIYSRMSSLEGIFTVSADIDHSCVEKNYLKTRENGEKTILPLVLDISNPTPSIGWANMERESFIKRADFDTILCLALVHHLAIGNNLPLKMIASFLSRICDNLIIEFVPKSDSNAKKLLAFRDDIFPDYDERNFEKEFTRHFELNKKKSIPSTQRTIYLFQRQNNPESSDNN